MTAQLRRFSVFFIFWSLSIFGLCGCESRPVEKASTKVDNVTKGKALYLSYGCAVCHGKNGDGQGLSSKSFYPPPIDLHEPKAYRHGNTKVDIRNTIKFGVREENSGMPAFDHLTEQELAQLTDFLISLQMKEKE